MGLQRERFQVWVSDANDKLTEYVATITHQDMLRGEQALLGTPGMNLGHGLALTTAWCWACLMRQGDYSWTWQQFRDMDCQQVEKLDPVDVDPTHPTTSDASP